jgi:hypothetical protein
MDQLVSQGGGIRTEQMRQMSRKQEIVKSGKGKKKVVAVPGYENQGSL